MICLYIYVFIYIHKLTDGPNDMSTTDSGEGGREVTTAPTQNRRPVSDVITIFPRVGIVWGRNYYGLDFPWIGIVRSRKCDG